MRQKNLRPSQGRDSQKVLEGPRQRQAPCPRRRKEDRAAGRVCVLAKKEAPLVCVHKRREHFEATAGAASKERTGQAVERVYGHGIGVTQCHSRRCVQDR